uniref:Uncharacterized protein n=1 Tax=Bursaphelenchus xylophilus TaxID=6326 RepID=A0A1I7RTU8_BURXY
MWCCVRHPSGRWKEEIGKFYSRKRALDGSLLHRSAGADGVSRKGADLFCVRHPSGRYKEEIGKFYSRKRALVGSLLHRSAGADGVSRKGADG